MKIRTGFVSNSSSSSFVVIGRKVSFSKVSLEDFKAKENWMIKTGYCYDANINIYTKRFDKKELDELYEFLHDESQEHEIYTHDLIEVYEYGGDG